MSKIFPSLLIGCLVASGITRTASAQYLTDMFTGTALNTSLWRATNSYSDSSVAVTGGSLVLTNSGKVQSVNQLPSAVDVTLKFRFSGNQYDVLRFATRTTGVSTNGSRGFDSAIFFSIQMRTDSGQTANNVYIHRDNFSAGQQNNSTTLAQGTYPIILNQDYTLRIVDDGTNLLFFVNDMTTPLVRATDSTVMGRFIGMFNREGAGAGGFISAGSQVRISAFTVNSASVVTLTNTITNTVTVPDTGGRLINLSTLGSGGFTMGFVVGGTTAKRMLVRAVGPTLQSFGVSGPASQTGLTVYSGINVIGVNSGWTNAPNAAQISAVGGPFPLIVGSSDSAVLAMLNPGNYTAQATANGAVLLEVYEAP